MSIMTGKCSELSADSQLQNTDKVISHYCIYDSADCDGSVVKEQWSRDRLLVRKGNTRIYVIKFCLAFVFCTEMLHSRYFTPTLAAKHGVFFLVHHIM